MVIGVKEDIVSFRVDKLAVLDSAATPIKKAAHTIIQPIVWFYRRLQSLADFTV